MWSSNRGPANRRSTCSFHDNCWKGQLLRDHGHRWSYIINTVTYSWQVAVNFIYKCIMRPHFYKNWKTYKKIKEINSTLQHKNLNSLLKSHWDWGRKKEKKGGFVVSIASHLLCHNLFWIFMYQKQNIFKHVLQMMLLLPPPSKTTKVINLSTFSMENKLYKKILDN